MANLLKIFAFPFAGGSRFSYGPLAEACGSNIVFIPMDYPGHGARMNEPLITDIHQIIDDIFDKVKDDLEQPYAFFGHSMGCAIVYLLTKKIIASKNRPPLHLFLSARGGPSCISTNAWYLLPPEEFLEIVISLGGTPPEVLRNKEVLNYFLPILRADFQALETYNYVHSDTFDIPLTVLIGKDDRVTRDEALGWQQETSLPIQILEFEGGHFFINNHSREIAGLFHQTVNESQLYSSEL